MNEAVLKKCAKPMMLTAAIIWGGAFVVMKNAIDTIPIHYLLAMRFLGGALLLSLVFFKKWKTVTWGDVWRGCVLGTLLFIAFDIQTFGLMTTTPSKNSFLTAIYCVIVPFLHWLVAKERPDRYHLIAAFLCVTGVGLVAINGSMTITVGDWLSLLCAFFYAAHMVAVNSLAEGHDVYLMTIFQFFSAGLLGLLGGLGFETAPSLAVVTEAAIPLLYLIVLSTAVALLCQNVGQVYCESPATASMLLSTESVFGVLFSVMFYGDHLTGKMICGFLLIFFAIVCSETKLSFLRRPSGCKQEE
ncbi:MAG: DMT family transporter [Oscillospiraceae bacterium]